MKRKIAAVFLILAILMVLFFTFQEPEQSRDLSEVVRTWLENQGMKIESHALRSNVHILEYFVLGLAVLAFGSSRGWKLGTCILLGCLIGLIDEGIKVLLPTREFDAIDLVKDWVGIGIATLIGKLLVFRRPQEND